MTLLECVLLFALALTVIALGEVNDHRLSLKRRVYHLEQTVERLRTNRRHEP